MTGIYKITNRVNNKCYIGKSESSIEDRLLEHKKGRNSSSHLQNAIKKYGIENFEFTVLEECLPEDCWHRERYWIEYFNSLEDGYNQTSGGENKSGWKHSSSTKYKISLRLKNVPKSDSHIENLKGSRPSMCGSKNPMYGKHFTSESKMKLGMSISNTIKNNHNGYVGESNNFYGKHHSESSKKRISNFVSNSIWVNNRSINKRVLSNDLDKYLSEGWRRGRISNKK